MKKKILIISLFYFPYVGGAEIAIREIFKRFPKDEYDLEIITSKCSLENKHSEILDNLKITRLGIGNWFFDKFFFPLFCSITVIFKKYDLIFSSLMNHAALASNIIYFFRKKPIIMNIQDGSKENEIKDKLGLFYFIYYKCYNQKFNYQVISNYLKVRCQNHGISKNKIKLVPNGVDLDIFTKKNSETEKNKLRLKLNLVKTDIVLVTTSRLSEKNGIDDVIKSLQFLDKNLKFLVCGTGEDEKKLKDLVKKLKLENRVIFVGNVDYNNLPIYLSISRIFIRPSLYEGLGNSFIESMAVEVPVIATNVGGIPDFLFEGKTGLFVKVRSPEDISKKVKMLINDKALYGGLKKEGKKLVIKKYSWNLISKQTEKYISKIIENET